MMDRFLALLSISTGATTLWWFAFHRNAGIAVTVATVVSAAFILAVRGWSTPWGKHGKVGAVVAVLVCVQASNGLLRKMLPRAAWSQVRPGRFCSPRHRHEIRTLLS